MTETLPARSGTDDEPDAPLELTATQRRKFLAYVTKNRNCSTRKALAEAGVKRSHTYRDKGGRTRTKMLVLTQAQAVELLDSDPELRDDYETARGRHAEQWRAKLVELALEGVDEPVWHNGVIVGYERKYSERLVDLGVRLYTPEGRALRTGAAIVEHTGHVVHEDRSAPLADLARVLEAAGALAEIQRGAAREDVPAAREVLPSPEHG